MLPCYLGYFITSVTLIPLLPCYLCYLVTSVTLLPCYLCYLVTSATLLPLLPCYLVTSVTLLPLLPCYLCYLDTSVTLLPLLPCYLVTSATFLPLLPCYLCYLGTSVTLLPLTSYLRALSLPNPCPFFAFLFTPFDWTTFHHYLGSLEQAMMTQTSQHTNNCKWWFGSVPNRKKSLADNDWLTVMDVLFRLSK